MIGDALAVVAANGCFLAAGAGLTRRFGLWRAPRQLAGALGPSYMVGVAGVGLCSTLLLLAGVPLRVWTVLATCAGFALLGWRARPGRPLLREAERPQGRAGRLLVIAVGVLVAVALLSFVIPHWTQPITAMDGWAKWTLKARAIVLGDGLDPRVFSGDAYRGLMPDYPLMLPSLEAIDFRFIGSPNTEVLFLQSWLLLCGFVVALAQCLRGCVSPLLVWPSLLLLAASPAFAEQVRGVLADAPLAYFVALAALAGWLALAEQDGRWLAVCALCASAAIALKDEGTPYAAGLLLLLWLFSWRSALRRPLAAATLAVVVTALPWRIWTATHGIGTALPLQSSLDPSRLAARADRVGPALGSLLAHAFDPRLFVLAVPLGCLAAVLLLARGREQRLPLYALLLVAVTCALCVWAYWASPSDLQYALGTSVSRVATTPAVILMAFLPLLLGALATEPAAVTAIGRERGLPTHPSTAALPRRYALARHGRSHVRRPMQ